MSKDQKTTPSSQKRPLIVTIISYFHLTVGILFFAALIVTIYYTIVDQPTLTAFIENYKLIGYNPTYLIILLSIVTVIGVTSGIGMLKGKRWAWHLAGIYYALNIFRNINGLFFIQRTFPLFPLEAVTSFINDPNLHYVKYIVRGSIFSFFYILMNTKRFREYFDMTLNRNMTILVIEFVSFIILASILSGYIYK